MESDIKMKIEANPNPTPCTKRLLCYLPTAAFNGQTITIKVLKPNLNPNPENQPLDW